MYAIPRVCKIYGTIHQWTLLQIRIYKFLLVIIKLFSSRGKIGDGFAKSLLITLLSNGQVVTVDQDLPCH